MDYFEKMNNFEKIADKIIKITNLFYTESISYPYDKAYFVFDYYRFRMLGKKEFNNYISYRLVTITKYLNEMNLSSLIFKKSYFNEFIKILKEKIPSAEDKFSDKHKNKIKDAVLGKPKLDCPNCPYKDNKEICNSKNYNTLCINCMEVN